MPSKRRQFNIRPDEATWALVEKVKPLASRAIGLDLSLPDLFRLGMLALAEKYAPPDAEAPKAPRGKKA